MQSISMRDMELKVGDIVEVITPNHDTLYLTVNTVKGDRIRLQTGLSFMRKKALKTHPYGAYIINRVL